MSLRHNFSKTTFSTYELENNKYCLFYIIQEVIEPKIKQRDAFYRAFLRCKSSGSALRTPPRNYPTIRSIGEDWESVPSAVQDANQDDDDIIDTSIDIEDRKLLPRLTNHCENSASGSLDNRALLDARREQLHAVPTSEDPTGLRPGQLYFSDRRERGLSTTSTEQDDRRARVLSSDSNPAPPPLSPRASHPTRESRRPSESSRASSSRGSDTGDTREQSASPVLQLLAARTSTSDPTSRRTVGTPIRDSLVPNQERTSSLAVGAKSFDVGDPSYRRSRQPFSDPTDRRSSDPSDRRFSTTSPVGAKSIPAKSFAPKFVGAKFRSSVPSNSASSVRRQSGRQPKSDSFTRSSSLDNRESTGVGPSREGPSRSIRESSTVGTFEPPTISSARHRHTKRDRSPGPHQYAASFARDQDRAARAYTLRVEEERIEALTLTHQLKVNSPEFQNRQRLLLNKKKKKNKHAILNKAKSNLSSYQRPLPSQQPRTQARSNHIDVVVRQTHPQSAQGQRIARAASQLAPGIVQAASQQGRYVTYNGRPIVQGGRYISLKQRYDPLEGNPSSQGRQRFDSTPRIGLGSIPITSVDIANANVCRNLGASAQEIRPIITADIINEYFGQDSATVDRSRTTSNSSRAPLMELKFELDTRLTVSCIVAAVCSYGFVTVSISLNSVTLAFANAFILLLIVFVLFGLDRFLARPRQVASTTR